jgi:hypothetical protein
MHEMNSHIRNISLLDDQRITVWHISLYVALMERFYANDFNNPVSITRAQMMKLAHIASFATYHKCIRQLQEFGYIKYLPSYDPSLGSRVYVLRL